MPRTALFALASPQQLEATVDRAVAEAEEVGTESVGSSCEPRKDRVKAWVNLAAGKVVISGQHAGEVRHAVSLFRILRYLGVFVWLERRSG